MGLQPERTLPVFPKTKVVSSMLLRVIIMILDVIVFLPSCDLIVVIGLSLHMRGNRRLCSDLFALLRIVSGVEHSNAFLKFFPVRHYCGPSCLKAYAESPYLCVYDENKTFPVSAAHWPRTTLDEF